MKITLSEGKILITLKKAFCGEHHLSRLGIVILLCLKQHGCIAFVVRAQHFVGVVHAGAMNSKPAVEGRNDNNDILAHLVKKLTH